jgi:hypothetical protein
MISLKDLKSVTANSAPCMLVYGQPGDGKTSLAASFPDPVFLQLEDGCPGDVEMVSFGLISDFKNMMSAISSLYDGDHDFKTVVIDSVTELQKIIFAETCARGDDKGVVKANIEDFGYGKGYVYAQRIWQEFLDGILALRRDRGMTVIMIAHSTIERFDDPESSSYDRYEIDLHKRSVGMIERVTDAILLIKRTVSIKKEDVGFNKERAIAEGGSSLFIFAEGRPAFVAKNRYGIPPRVRYEKGQGFEAIKQYLPIK